MTYLPKSETPPAVATALLASGFPFQTAVAKAVSTLEGWQVIAEEFPWRDDAGADQFVDLVASNDRFVVVIECKKTQKEILTFLDPLTSGAKVARSRVLYLEQIQDSTKRMELFWADRFLSPVSFESAFCVVSTSDSGKDQRLLERDGSRLVRGTDAYATHYHRTFKVKQQPEPDRFVIPILVTNAKLFIARYDPGKVSMETGQFETPPHAEITSVDWVRFRKSFTSYGPRDVGPRTVYVVAAQSLVTFLQQLSLSDGTVLGKIGFR